MDKNSIEKSEFDAGVSKSKARYGKYGKDYDLYLNVKDSMAIKDNDLPFRVTKHNCPKCKQGFTYWYRYYEGNKRKTLTAVKLNKLKEKVLSKSLPWLTFDEMKYLAENKSADDFK